MLLGHSSGCAIALAAADAGLPVTGLVLFEAPIGQFAGGAAGFERDSGADARPRFGTVVDDATPPLASPRLPSVELLPRGRAKRRG